MPNYAYRAREGGAPECCGEGFLILQRISDDPLEACPDCNAPVRRVMQRTQNMTNRRWNTKKMLSDGNLKRLGFKKMVKESDGNYVDALAD